ncbi:PD-(D/E)XK nuclease family protein [Bacillus subtilis]|uniref:PD-(D/E)XK nuclease family protein n=1 Tax=Bacillus subtilis TaxID=1423 RepID=UPI002DBC00A6|nr:PD-(D/E)XK nuclease family protein [Bacillus subtilis]MEC2335177.1 PD-(D/E)XK nuclease family protein [Bacillus subtilis]
MRLSYDQLDIIKEKMGVDKLWSFSKISTYDQCSWLYKLKYIDKIKSRGDNCYTYFGSLAHELIQDFYEDKIKYEEMISKFEDKVLEWQMLDDPKLKFSTDQERDRYIENLRHYFKNVQTVPHKITNEQAVLAVFEGMEKYVFQGYLDSEYLDDQGNLVILDYKTSTKSGFSGKQLFKKARQLIIYAIGISQHGRMINGEMRQFPLDKIRIRYDMLKYCNVSFMQKNGKIKTTKAERRQWVAHLANQLRKDFEGVPKDIEKLEKEIAKLQRKMMMKKTTPEEAEGYSVGIGEIEEQIKSLKDDLYDPVQVSEMIEKATLENSLSALPKFIQNKYTVENCYIDVELTDEIVEEAKEAIISLLDDITVKSKEDDKDQAFNRSRIENSESFYCANTCDMKDHCTFYKEYKEHNTMFMVKSDQPSDDELLAMLGLE